MSSSRIVVKQSVMVRGFLLLFVAFGLLLPFHSTQAQTPANLMLQKNANGSAQLSINGAMSNACTVQFTTGLAASNTWHFLAYFQLTNVPALYSDTNQANLRFYRVFTQQLPTNVVPVPNMVWISSSSFTMGSPASEALRDTDEVQHVVTLSHGFFIGQYLVIQSNYLALIGSNPSFFSTNHGFLQGLSRPVDSITWSDATNYCAQLTQEEISAGRLPATGWAYRLPTESEWEYACRAGTTNAFYLGNQIHSGMANFNGQYEYDSTSGTITNASGIFLSQTTPVGNYEPNLWGLFDMCGNVFEWCQDLYGSYPTGNVTDPQGATTGTDHVLRGGGWDAQGQYCRSAQRAYSSSTSIDIGFRIVLAPN